jgi:hypothetical protein
VRAPLTCSTPSTDVLRLAPSYVYTGPARSLDELKTTLSTVPIPVFDEWVRSDSPVRVNLRDLKIVGKNLEGRGLSSNTESKFDVVLTTETRQANGESWFWIKSLRLFHKNMGRHIEVACAAPRFPDDRGQINAFGAGAHVSRCKEDTSPDKERSVKFHLNFLHYAEQYSGTVRASLEYNDGRQWIPTNGFAVSAEGNRIFLGSSSKDEAWVGKKHVTFEYKVSYPGEFRVSYKARGSDGIVLSEGATRGSVVANDGCKLRPTRDVDHAVAPYGTRSEPVSTTPTVRSALCPAVMPAGTPGTLLIAEELRCKSPMQYEAERKRLESNAGKALACEQAFFLTQCQ